MERPVARLRALAALPVPPIPPAAPLPPVLAAAFAALALAMAVLFVLGARFAPVADNRPRDRRRATRAALGVAVLYLGASAALAQAGLLSDVDARPPAVAFLLVALTSGMAALAVSRLGDRLLAWPLGVLVGVQAFRIAVEALLVAAYRAGTVPVEMTPAGVNFDIAAGVLAAGIGVWAAFGTVPRWAVAAWNGLGLVLLVVVVATAAASAFGVAETTPRLTLPTAWPGVWLPAWLVQLAFLGHLLVFRALRRSRARAPR